ELAAGPCARDPRTVAQRRADALLAVMAGHRRLRCTCGHDACLLTGDSLDLSHPAPPRPRAEIHVIVAAETLAGAADLPGILRRLGVIDPDTVRRLAADATWRALLTLDGTPVHLGRAQPAGMVISGPADDTSSSAIPAGLRRTAATGPVVCVDHPDPDTDPSVLRYTPSPALAALVRDRDGH
ncbi:DUF222 domain-containing protein, partial [Rhodococcus aerolatus]